MVPVLQEKDTPFGLFLVAKKIDKTPNVLLYNGGDSSSGLLREIFFSHIVVCKPVSHVG
jgi:hypothetical protein